MKAKLSTEILQKGEKSPFMRVNKGTFALRDRYQKALLDEDILVFPQASLRNYIPGPGYVRVALIVRNCSSTVDPCVGASVFVVRHDHKILTFKRTKRLPERRLHGSTRWLLEGT